MRLLRLLWAFVVRDAKIAFSYRLQFFFQSASVLSLSITFFFLSLMMKGVEGGIVALDRYGGGYFGFVLVGIAFSTYLDAALRTFSASVRQAQITGTLEAMLTTSSPIGAMVFGSALYTLLFTTARVGLFLFLGVFMFGLRLHGEAWLGAVTVVALTVTATFALGIFAAGFIVLFKQGDPVSAAVNGLSWLLSGVLYPKEILPAWVQDVADLLPMTHTLEAVRLAILTGAPLADLMGAVTYLGGFSAVGIPVSLLWFAWAVKRARVAGSLASY
ncbi:MAG: ABC transporter permease [Deltaproteobacteria bacterium]